MRKKKEEEIVVDTSGFTTTELLKYEFQKIDKKYEGKDSKGITKRVLNIAGAATDGLMDFTLGEAGDMIKSNRQKGNGKS